MVDVEKDVTVTRGRRSINRANDGVVRSPTGCCCVGFVRERGEIGCGGGDGSGMWSDQSAVA